jgi:hypothetical protein
VTLDDVRRLGLPVRMLTDEEARRQPRLPGKTFAEDAAGRAAAEKLRAILRLKGD